jgi:hypothetical protein
MSVNVRRVDYFRAEVEDTPGTAYDFLKRLSTHKVNLLAISAVPVGPTHTQFTLFPERSDKLIEAAQRLNLTLSGPERAILIHGEDHLGALVEPHRKLADARINVFATYGVTGGKGGYGYVIHVRRGDLDAAATALGAD